MDTSILIGIIERLEDELSSTTQYFKMVDVVLDMLQQSQEALSPDQFFF